MNLCLIKYSFLFSLSKLQNYHFLYIFTYIYPSIYLFLSIYQSKGLQLQPLLQFKHKKSVNIFVFVEDTLKGYKHKINNISKQFSVLTEYPTKQREHFSVSTFKSTYLNQFSAVWQKIALCLV